MISALPEPMRLRIAERFEALRSDPDFDVTACWLTFYLGGTEEGLRRIATDLVALDARNLNGADSGFIYAKVPVISRLPDVLIRIGEVVALCISAEVDISIIDLDIQPDPREETRFATLYKA